MTTTTTTINSESRFILDILESQKRNKEKPILDLIKTELNDGNVIELELLDQLQNMPIITTTTTTTTQKRKHLTVDGHHKESKRKGKKPNLNRDHLSAHQNLVQDFFTNNNGDEEEGLSFENEFGISKSIFDRIRSDLTKKDPHFIQRKDALGNLGHSSEQKLLVSVRQLVYGIGHKRAILDRYIRMAESTALESLLRFCTQIDALYSPSYLRLATPKELREISTANQRRGFKQGFHAYLGHKSWTWKSCPTGWNGRFKSASSPDPLPTLIFEGLVDWKGWIWNGFVSTPGNCKDLDLFKSVTLPIYSVNYKPLQSEDTHGDVYYLADSIYPPVPPIESTQPDLHKLARLDFDTTINHLLEKFKVLTEPCRLWSTSNNSMDLIIKTVLILHNMMVEESDLSTERPERLLPPVVDVDLNQGDIQVQPSACSSTTLPSTTATTSAATTAAPITAHVLAKLNHRYQFYNPNSSLLV
ncbi:hypothetical protein MJO29_014849 [Puccinia striiformis f. sp. tritici]|nr:hypothetical protein Pst134EB_033182 [Puccinia striiformis f. sp. tritici]KAI7937534.1 hypothetical protein MJO29_014849 [Puccinia striiformis f. sp. tritici]